MSINSWRPSRAGGIVAELKGLPDRDAGAELRVLRESMAPQKKTKRSLVTTSVSKTSLRLGRPEGEARVTASDGKVELRLDRDFSAVPRAKLQEGIEAFLATLDQSE
jgi:ParB family chromosome partitioning protein